ncbi:MAG: Putative large exoprotein involved in heme utilization or adhesion of ShlA/HecA/FhaA family [Burkholderiaceae bacterium]|jgi:filamentous hemagglutinin|nr:MAG: Putative large exoprotein involved in heme utilization or adhesion of ShlA/HecA/FhaA family [Burkholderiaceae bacterium]
MNQRIHRIVFNRRRGQLMAVAETATNAGKAAGGERRSAGARRRGKAATHGALATLAVLSMLMATADPALAQIVANPHAPGTRQATVLNAGNGVPLVNIQTPNAAGVSMNSYSQFDVQKNGAVLNNSRTNAQTQLGGWVQGNPWLATGPASVIVNQVTSGNPSLLNGYVEVAGRRAGVVIANPSGISVNGGGFINASGVTLTTGVPQFGGNGALTGYSVQGGQISVGGQGLDLSGTDYAQLLARAVTVNAGIWANNLKVVTGINDISADASSVAASGAAPQGATPAFAVDVAQLGGMYAGKIFLVSTEAGLGVRNAGTLAASSGPLTLSADGKLSNTGTVAANAAGQDVTLNVQGLANSGTVASQHDVHLTDAGTASSNSGRINADGQFVATTNTLVNQAGGSIAAQGLQITAQTLQNAGTLQQTGAQALNIQTANLANSGAGAVIGAPLTSTNVGGASAAPPGSGSAASGSAAPSTATGGSSTVATGGTTAPAQVLPTGRIQAAQGVQNSGQILANGATDVTTSQSLANSGTLNVRNLSATGSFDNSQGQTQVESFAGAQTSFANQGGRFFSTADLNLSAQSLDNSGGQIQSGAALTVVSAGAVNNTGGQLLAAGALRVSASGAVTNTGGRMLGDAGVTLASAILANDQNGAIGSAAGAVAISTGALNNRGGTLVAANALAVDSAGLDNTQGTVATTQAGSTLALSGHGGNIVNSGSGAQGGILSAGTLSVDAQGGQLINSNGGVIAAVGDVALAAATIANQGGAIASNANVQIASTAASGTGIDNSASGQIQAQGNLTLAAGSAGIANGTGSMAANQNVAIVNGGVLDNSHGTIRAGQSLAMTDAQVASGAAVAAATQDVVNTGGTLQAGQSLAVQSRSLSGDGSVQSGGDLSVALASGFTETAGGTLAANGRLSLSSQGDITNQGQIGGGSAVSVAAGNINNQAGASITSAGATTVSASGALTNRGLIDGSDTQIDAGTVNNIGTGRIYGDHLSIAADTVNNQAETVGGTTKSATIAARGTLDIAAQVLSNTGGSTVLSLGDMNLAGALDANRSATQGQMAAIRNDGSTIEAGGNLLLAAAEIDNTNANLVLQRVLVASTSQPDMVQLPGGQPLAQSNFAWQLQDNPGINVAGGPALVLTGFTGGPELVQPAHPDRYSIQYPPAYVPEHSVCSVGDGSSCTAVPASLEPRNSPRFAQYGVNPPPQVAVPQPDPTAYGAIAMPTGSPMDGTVSTTYYWPAGSNQAGYNAALAGYNADQAAYISAAQALNDAITAANTENRRILGYSGGENYTAITGVVQQVSEDRVVQSSPGRITAGGDLTITGQLNNSDSSVIAGGNISIAAGNLNNAATQGTQTTTTSGTAQQYHITYHSGGMFGSASYSDDPQGAPAPFTSTTAQSIDLGTTVLLQGAPPALGAGVSANGNTGRNVGSAGPPVAGLSQVPHTGNAPPTVSQYPTTSAAGQPLTVRTLAGGPALPTSSLYTLNPSNPNAPLVETDPAFTNRGQWLGSNYLLGLLGVDPASTQQRLGDGFYEQQLVAQQVAQLTGRRFIGDYTREDQEYQALMDAGATFAEQFDLRPGVALTASQIAQLTSDIVWLVSEAVTLPDGSTRQVLVPRLYVLAQSGDFAPSGALISGNSVAIAAGSGGGTVTNSGTIAGRNAVQISATDIADIGGRITGNQVGLAATRDINVVGGSVEAVQTLLASAGRDINVASSTRTNQGGTQENGYSNTVLDRVGSLSVTGTSVDSADPSSGVLQVSAGRDVNLSGASVSNAAVGGRASIEATRDLNLSTVATSSQLNMGFGEGRHLNQGASSETGTQINTAGDLNLQAGRDLTARAAQVQAQGALAASAGHDLTITTGQATQSLDDAYHYQGKSLLGSSSGGAADTIRAGNALSSNFGGNTAELKAGNDLAVQGSTVIGDKGASLTAGHDIAITAAQNQSNETHSQQEAQSGLFSGGGVGFTIGNRQQSSTMQGATTASVGSTVGAIAGDVTMEAGNDYRQVGSDVVAASGDVNIAAKDVAISEARNTQASQLDQKFSQSGLSVALSGGVISVAQSAAASAQGAVQSDSRRDKLLSALSLYGKGEDLAAAAQAVGNAGNAQDAAAASGIKLSISIGSAKSESSSSSISNTGSASHVQAGGNVNIKTTAGDITVQGSAINAGQDATLDAKQNINLLASADTESNRSTNSSSNASVGVSFGFGANGFGISLDVAASRGAGQANSDSTTWNNARVAAGNQLTLRSGGDTNLIGAVASGNQVTADVGGNLHIASLQDTAVSDASQHTEGFAMSIPIYGATGFSASASSNRQDSHGNYASVYQQSGIAAGNGGFDIKVAGHTQLDGAVIASSAPADQSRLQTTTLSTTDIQNRMDASASSSGMSIGTDVASGYGAAKGALGNLLNHGSAGVSDASISKSAISAGQITLGGVITDTSTKPLADSNGRAINIDTSDTNRVLANADLGQLQQTAQDKQASNMLVASTVTVIGDPVAAAAAGKKISLQICDANGQSCASKQVDPSQIVKGPDGNIYVYNNGIFNNEQQALANAAKQSSSEANQQGVYVVVNPYTGNTVSELVYAGYDKLNNMLGAALPITGSSEANIDIRDQAAQQGAQVVEVDHSRGSLTGMNALQAQANAGQSDVPLSSVTFNGAAANAQAMANLCATASGGGCTVQQSTHQDDPVGTWIGGNPATGGAAGTSMLDAHTNYSGQVPAPFLPNGQPNRERTGVDKTWGSGQYSQPVVVPPISADMGAPR